MRRLKLVIAFLLLIPFCGNGQVYSWDWAVNGSNPGASQGNHIAADQFGNVYMIGSFEGTLNFGTATLSSTGGKDIFIAKYTVAGDLLWAKKAGGYADDDGTGIACDKQGNIYIAGSFTDSALFESLKLTGAGDEDAFLCKYDSAGNIVWARSGGSQYEDMAGLRGGVALDNFGNVYLSGMFSVYGGSPPVYVTASFGPIIVTSSGNGDIFLAKYDTAGNIKWVKTAGYKGNDDNTDLSVDNLGNIYLAGAFGPLIRFGATQIPSIGDADVFIAKYDSSGQFLWARNAGAPGDNIYTGSIATDVNSNAYVTGIYHSSLHFGSYVLSSIYNGDIFIAKYDASGNFLWARSGGGTSFDAGIGITTDKVANVYVTGNFNYLGFFGNDTLHGVGGPDIVIAKYDKDGNEKWATAVGGSGYEIGNSLVCDDMDHIYLTGYFNSSNIIFGGSSLSCGGSSDAFLARLYASTTGIEEENSKPEGVAIYPNPTNGSFVVNTTSAGYLHITNVTGQEISSYKIAAGKNGIAFAPGVKAGIYTGIFVSDGRKERRVVKIEYRP